MASAQGQDGEAKIRGDDQLLNDSDGASSSSPEYKVTDPDFSTDSGLSR